MVYTIVCAVVAVAIEGYSEFRKRVLFSDIVAVAAPVFRKTQQTPNLLVIKIQKFLDKL